jgi:hypothetical protein
MKLHTVRFLTERKAHAYSPVLVEFERLEGGGKMTDGVMTGVWSRFNGTVDGLRSRL